MPSAGTLTLHIRDKQVGEADDHDPARASSASAAAASSSGARAPSRSPTTIPGDGPGRSSGGTIKRVVIDVSGEAFVDLAPEARAAFARQ